ncbi:hypothetical protein LPJ59_001456 [Coemansia sp. RSA 2399]|nr:hypothetical protein LPJ59_001456 [Coemansia sp. RSA 2399]KAJ1896626.1 hypothetical protein LPJ81_004701 [Coemansia sp. IMI 209127]
MSLQLWSQKRHAGHSRWSKIRHSKGASDIKKGLLFSAISKNIITCVRDGGADAKTNLRLAALLKQARLADMPKENIERAIKRATSKEYSGAEQVVYEGQGPHGTALIVECLTDNKNRTVKALRNTLSRFGGSLAPVGYMFEKKGRICFAQDGTSHSFDTMIEHAIDAGAEDISELEDAKVEVICKFSELQAITKVLTDSHGYTVECMEGAYIPNTSADISESNIAEVQAMLETIEELEDVITVHCNL